MSPASVNAGPGAPRGDGRDVIVLNHFFKNAGSTLVWALRRSFGTRFADYRRLKCRDAWSNEALLDFLRDEPDVRAVEIHHYPCGLLRDAEFALHNILFLRHPLDRLRSTYDFYRQHPPAEGPLISAARENDLPGFLRHLLSLEQHPSLHSQQVRRLCRLDRTPGRDDLALAVAMVRGMQVPGLVERFDDSAVLGEVALRARFAELDLSYVPRNVSAGRPDTLAERMDQLADQIGRALYDDLVERNALDLELLSETERELDRRIAATDDFEALKADFLARCAAHSGQAEPPEQPEAPGPLRRTFNAIAELPRRLNRG